LRKEAAEAWSEVSPSVAMVETVSTVMISAGKTWQNSPWVDLIKGRTFRALSKFAWRGLKEKADSQISLLLKGNSWR